MKPFISILIVLSFIAACGVTEGTDTTNTTVVVTTTSTAMTTTSSDTTTATIATTSSTTSTSTTTTIPAVGEPQTEEHQSDGFPGAGETGFLTDIEIATHQGYDRVVFEFDKAAPEFRIRYVEPPIEESPSGQEIDMQGTAFLEITMSPGSAVDLSGDAPEETYDGPDRFEPDEGPPIEEVVKTEDFEHVMAWVIGLDAEHPFSFTTLEDPHRLVVDIHTD